MSSSTSRARARRAALLVTAVAVVALGAGCRPRPVSGREVGGGGGVATDIARRHDAARAAAGMAGLVVDGAMNANAQLHADRMARGGGGCNIWHSNELGAWYAGHSAAENVSCIAPCPGDGGQAMSMWLASPEHRVNVLDPAFHRIGVGVTCNGREMLAVVHFRD